MSPLTGTPAASSFCGSFVRCVAAVSLVPSLVLLSPSAAWSSVAGASPAGSVLARLNVVDSFSPRRRLVSDGSTRRPDAPRRYRLMRTPEGRLRMYRVQDP